MPICWVSTFSWRAGRAAFLMPRIVDTSAAVDGRILDAVGTNLG